MLWQPITESTPEIIDFLHEGWRRMESFRYPRIRAASKCEHKGKQTPNGYYYCSLFEAYLSDRYDFCVH